MRELPVSIYFSERVLEGSVRQRQINALGKSCLIVCGASSAYKSGVMDDLLPLLKKNKQKYQVFIEIRENPDLESIMRGKELLLEGGFDFVIGIGGGSPLDAAKAIMLAAANDLGIDELYNVERMTKRLPLVLIPTTHGTGSEVTQYSVLTDTATGRKAGFGSELAFADMALINPRYALSLSPRISLNTSIDALSHLLEGIYSTQRDKELYSMIAEGISLIMQNLELCLKEPQYLPAREALMRASMLGGVTIAHTSTTLQHAIGYPFTTLYDIPHGLANGIFMRQMMDFYYSEIGDEIAQVLEMAATTREAFYAWLEKFPLDIKVPITDEIIEAKIPEILGARNTVISPRKPTPEELRALLKTVQK
ncbi:MAG: iron-containing alcohol dehydrogenase [Candidatus Cloacimonetes bacterium]|nr:iron-containing alcohol dehydrogenase [Candidatus Cloacimonadota bacterium]